MRRSGKTQGRPPRRGWISYFFGLVLLVLLVIGFWPRPIPVEISQARSGTLRSTVNEEGKTRIKHRFLVSAPTGGRLRRIGLKAGALVRSNETVAVIDPLPPAMLDARARSLAVARRESALANVARSRAAREFALKEEDRLKRLFAEKTVPAQELEAAELRAISAGQELAMVEGALREVEAELSEFDSGGPIPATRSIEVRAPTSGWVLRIAEESSRVVTAGMPLLEIGDAGDLEVVIEVLSRDGAAIPAGAKVEFHQWGGEEPLHGRVRLVEPAAFTKISALGVEEQRVNVIADFTSPSGARKNLGDNFRVEARIVTWETERTLKVPAGALFRRGEGWAVFVVEGGRARARAVRVGKTSGTETEIINGLKEGDAVIVYPGDRVSDGQRIRALKIAAE